LAGMSALLIDAKKRGWLWLQLCHYVYYGVSSEDQSGIPLPDIAPAQRESSRSRRLTPERLKREREQAVKKK
jgi:hypothetical protein